MQHALVADCPDGEERAPAGVHRILQVGALALNLDLRRACHGGQLVPLSPAEFSVLALLASRPNVAMTRDVILDELEAGPIRLDPRLIDVYINRARRKLEGAGAGSVIQTVAGRGYALTKPDRGRHRDPTRQDGLHPVPVAA